MHVKEEEATKDSLTKLFNRGYFNKVLDELCQGRNSRAFSLVMFDIDNFKLLNDCYGHTEGDLVLIELAKIVLGSLREGDLAFRYGGEEFIIILPATSKKKAVAIAERLRLAVEKAFLGRKFKVTISVGVAGFPDDANNTLGITNVADTALYKAKEKGKNKVVAS